MERLLFLSSVHCSKNMGASFLPWVHRSDKLGASFCHGFIVPAFPVPLSHLQFRFH